MLLHRKFGGGAVYELQQHPAVVLWGMWGLRKNVAILYFRSAFSLFYQEKWFAVADRH